ncbi:isochorismatase family protein [Streptococcus sanguinis]|uniref:Isochorismatase family protein n=1 Tax=Streptococcus sanguinis TaxID=1305 RepID=A0A3P1S489_STRSA|nr:isochorismatase family protein [Streptococcus sanguinis]RRC92049.1 isochorismatase family protein [Streptococcus sanguinis]
MKTALIIIDVQNILVETGFQSDKMMDKISFLQHQARSKGVEIIYIQHMENPEDSALEDWQRYNSIFKETGLKDYLDKEDIGRLVLCGMQTEYCVDASVKVGFEFDYKLVIPEGAFTTFDGEEASAEKINTFYQKIWDGRFADVRDYKNIFN